MKRLTLTALLLVALTTGAIAHEGSIGLFTNSDANDCDVDFTPYLASNITIMYFRSDAGPDGIFAAEFKVVVPDGQMVISSFTPSPQVTLIMGDISTGIACSYGACTGTGSDYTLIGEMSVLPMFAVPVPLQIRVMASNNLTEPPFAPIVARCDETRTIVGVLGGWFSSPEGSCSTGTEETTWGAIKEMYRD